MLPLLLVMLTGVSPSPSPTATPQLQTIVTVKSSALCGEFAAHTNAAIDATVGNDKSLGSTIVTLKSRDLAGNDIVRGNELHRLEDLSTAIYRGYRTGENEVGEMRELATKAKDPQEKAELLASANALGGALYRQHLMQRDLDGFLAYMNASDMITGDRDDPMNDPPPAGGVWIPTFHGASPLDEPGDETPADDVRMALEASTDFQSRLPALMKDEMTAATHIENAAEGC